MSRRIRLMATGAVLAASTVVGATAASASAASPAPKPPTPGKTLTCSVPKGLPHLPGKGKTVTGSAGRIGLPPGGLPPLGSAPRGGKLTLSGGKAPAGDGKGVIGGETGPGEKGLTGAKEGPGGKAGAVTIVVTQGTGRPGGYRSGCTIGIRVGTPSDAFVKAFAGRLGVPASRARRVLTSIDRLGTVEVSSGGFSGVARSAGVSSQKLEQALVGSGPNAAG